MHLIRSMQKQVNRALPDDLKMMVSYTGKKTNTCFNVKDKTVFEDEHDIVHYAERPEESYLDIYVVESDRGVLERVKDYNGRDTSSHISQDYVS